MVGNFVATDPDGNGSLSYYLHGGHAYFTMDLNGTLPDIPGPGLRIERKSPCPRRAYDLNQSYAEGNFTVTVLER